jgi:hypothetical protein
MRLGNLLFRYPIRMKELSILLRAGSHYNCLFACLVISAVGLNGLAEWYVPTEIVVLALIGGLGVLYAVHHNTRKEVGVWLQELERERYVEGLPSLFHILTNKHYDKCHERKLLASLTFFLNSLTSQETYLISTEHVRFINQKVSIDRNKVLLLPLEYSFRKCDIERYMDIWNKLDLAMIRILPEVGNEQSLKVLQGVSKRKTDNQRSETLKAAAMRAIPLLEQRLEAIKMRETLLRPAALEESEKDLLRPSTYSEETPAEVLLRPTSPETPET